MKNEIPKDIVEAWVYGISSIFLFISFILIFLVVIFKLWTNPRRDWEDKMVGSLPLILLFMLPIVLSGACIGNSIVELIHYYIN